MNPSWEIASSLPQYLPVDRAKDLEHRSSPQLPKVRLLVYPEPIRVNYQVVRKLIPTLWDNVKQKIDFALHIGMSGPALIYSVENRAHRDGYKLKDVDGNLLEDDERHKEERDSWIWHGLPHELVTDLDIDDIYKRWVDRSPKDQKLRISNDAGHYLCDFIYYSSQAHLYKQQRPRKVVFMHVPASASKQQVSTGMELALNLIRSIVESELSGENVIDQAMESDEGTKCNLV